MITRVNEFFPSLTNLQTEVVKKFFDRQARDQNYLLKFIGAPTGVGKTLCYLLCTLGLLNIKEDSVTVETRTIQKGRDKGSNQSEVVVFKPQVVICIETQSLIEQVFDEINKLIPPNQSNPYSKLKARKLFKGERMESWVEDDKKQGRCDILISSPHLLNSLSEKVDQSGRVIDFSNTKFFISDEAESVWENDNEKIKKIINKVYKHNKEPKNLMFMFVSATLDKKTRHEILDYINDTRPPTNTKAKVIPDYYQLKLEMTVHQRYVEVDDKNRKEETFNILKQVLIENRNSTQIMIFLPSQKKVEEYVADINKNETFKGSNIVAVGYHSKLEDKQKNLNNFRKGDYKILCCTEVLARGIDIPGVGLVIIPYVPRITEHKEDRSVIHKDVDSVTYMHMVGRTGRFILKGTSIVFYQKDDKKGQYNSDKDLETSLHTTIMELAQKDADIPLPDSLRNADKAAKDKYINEQKKIMTDKYIKELDSQGYLQIKSLDLKDFIPTLKDVLDYNKKIVESNKVSDKVVVDNE